MFDEWLMNKKFTQSSDLELNFTIELDFKSVSIINIWKFLSSQLYIIGFISYLDDQTYSPNDRMFKTSFGKQNTMIPMTFIISRFIKTLVKRFYRYLKQWLLINNNYNSKLDIKL